MTALSCAVLAALLVTAVWLMTGTTPALISSGLAIAAASPLVFISWQAWRRPGGKRSHPIMVSVCCGLGCVMVMAGVHRFGEHYKWILIAAVAALCLWMCWQRWVWRKQARIN